MNERDASERPAATDPETEEAAEIQEAAEAGDHAAQVALEEAGPANASPDEPARESVEELGNEIREQESVIEIAVGDTSVMESAPPAEAEAEAPETPAAESEVIGPESEPADIEVVEAASEPAEAAPTEAESEAGPVEAKAEAPAESTPEPTAVPVEVAATPFEGPGEWYVVHTYAGYETKVKANLHSRINSMQMEDKIFDVVIPMEDVMEIKGGKKQVVQRKVFPGYLLVKMVYDNDSWYVVRNTPGVTGFVASGTGTKPTPLSRREVEKILAVKEETQKKPEYRLEWEEGDVVRIIAGPFADFQGTIAEINVEQSKLKVLVNIFDRETPVELAFDQVAKA